MRRWWTDDPQPLDPPGERDEYQRIFADLDPTRPDFMALAREIVGPGDDEGMLKYLEECYGHLPEIRSLAGFAEDEMPRGLSGMFGTMVLTPLRRPLCGRYAWAIPNQAALNAIAACSPLIEVGAGNGYWAHLLQRLGADILCYDEAPPPDPSNAWCKGPTWTAVNRAGAEVTASHPDRNLFLCWPPMSDMAEVALRNFRGETLLHVGEGLGGAATGSEEFQDMVEADFERVGAAEIPQYEGLHDFLEIWRRKR